MNKNMIWIIIVIIALIAGVFGGYTYENTKLSNQMMISKSALQKQVQDLQAKNDQLMKTQHVSEDAMIGKDKMMQTSPSPSAILHEKISPTGEMMK